MEITPKPSLVQTNASRSETERDTERETEIQRERERERETDRQRERQRASPWLAGSAQVLPLEPGDELSHIRRPVALLTTTAHNGEQQENISVCTLHSQTSAVYHCGIQTLKGY